MILVTGGIKSGKSSLALKLAMNYDKRAFLATGVPFDEEMRTRIDRHKLERGDLFETFEEPLNVAEVLRKLDGRYDVVVFECLTTYLGNLFHYEVELEKYVESFVNVVCGMSSELVVVTNEVGWGIVPENAVARKFAYVLGSLNTRLAKLSREVYLVVSGIGVRIK